MKKFSIIAALMLSGCFGHIHNVFCSDVCKSYKPDTFVTGFVNKYYNPAIECVCMMHSGKSLNVWFAYDRKEI